MAIENIFSQQQNKNEKCLRPSLEGHEITIDNDLLACAQYDIDDISTGGAESFNRSTRMYGIRKVT